MSHAPPPPTAQDGETVYTTVSKNRTQRSGSQKVFHTDRDCSNLTKSPGGVQDHDRRALTNGWRECKSCAGEESAVATRAVFTCPHCGRPCENLPNHLRGCDK